MTTRDDIKNELIDTILNVVKCTSSQSETIANNIVNKHIIFSKKDSIEMKEMYMLTK